MVEGVSAAAVPAVARVPVSVAVVMDKPRRSRCKGFTSGASLGAGSGHDNGASAPVFIGLVRCDPLCPVRLLLCGGSRVGCGEDVGYERRGTPHR